MIKAVDYLSEETAGNWSEDSTMYYMYIVLRAPGLWCIGLIKLLFEAYFCLLRFFFRTKHKQTLKYKQLKKSFYQICHRWNKLQSMSWEMDLKGFRNNPNPMHSLCYNLNFYSVFLI